MTVGHVVSATTHARLKLSTNMRPKHRYHTDNTLLQCYFCGVKSGAVAGQLWFILSAILIPVQNWADIAVPASPA